MTVIKLQRPSDSGELDHTQLAEMLASPDDLVFCQAQFWRVDADNIWRPYPDEQITQHLQEECRAHGLTATANRVRGAAAMAKGVFYRDVAWDQADRRAICASNGVLTYHGGVWQLAPYKRDDFRRIRLAVEYDPKATAPRFQQYLAEVFRGCPDAKDRAHALLEFIGLSLTTSTEFERALMLLGNGSNGKSKALTVISEMVGTDHRAAIALDQLDNRFQLAHLDAKLINVMSETSEGGDLPDAQIKQLISGELITAEHKLRPPFSFRPMAKFWLATNHLPSTRDFSEGVFRRFTVLAFPNKFERGKQDTDLDAKLRAELPGILNLALMALGEAFDRGTLTEPPSSREILANWRRSSDQVLQFFDEELVDDPGISTPSADIYQAYQEWATRAGVMRKLGRNSLTQRLAAMGYEPAKGTGGVRLIWGLRCRLASDWGRQ